MSGLDWLFEGIGMMGVACFLVAYYLLQAEKLTANELRYLLLNLVGAMLVMVSLMWHWNFSAFLLEAAWMLITMYGIVKCLKKRGGAGG